jgi:hypothetical protein
MKRFPSITATLALAFAMLWRPVFATGPQDTPEARAAAFYAWFIKSDSDHAFPLKEQAIEKYVAKETVSRLRDDYAHEGPPNGVDYFLKVQDYDDHDWLSHIATHPAIMLDGVAIVPVTFGSKDKVNVLVFMRRLHNLWKITKVDDTTDYK